MNLHRYFISALLVFGVTLCVHGQVTLTTKEYDKLNARIKELEEKCKNQEKDYTTLKEKTDSLKRDNKKRQESLDKSSKKISELKKEIEILKGTIKEKEEYIKKNDIEKLKDDNASMSALLSEKDSILTVRDEYIKGLDAFVIEFTKENLIKKCDVFNELYSKIELKELHELANELEPFAASSDEWACYKNKLDTVISLKELYLLGDSVLRSPFVADLKYSYFDAFAAVDSAYLSPEQYAEFKTCKAAILEYGRLLMGFGEFVDGFKDDYEVKGYREGKDQEGIISLFKQLLEDKGINAEKYKEYPYLLGLFNIYCAVINEDAFYEKNGKETADYGWDAPDMTNELFLRNLNEDIESGSLYRVERAISKMAKEADM